MDKEWHFDGIVNHYEIGFSSWDVLSDPQAGRLIGLLSVHLLLSFSVSCSFSQCC